MNRVRAYLELGKPRLSALAVFAVLAGLWMGVDRTPDTTLLLATTAATLLVAFGSNAFNMLLEREHDRRMSRTASRPLPTGRLRPEQAASFGGLAVAAGLALLVAFANLLATALCAAIFATYVGVYTPLKRRTPLNTIVGAIPGALPPVVGYAAAAGRVDLRGAILFLIVFFWQIPHFLAIAWRYRADYEAGGMKMLPVVDPHGHVTSTQMVVWTAALIVTTLYAHFAGLAGPLYLMVALLAGLVFTVSVTIAAVLRRESAMRQTFLVSIVYLPVVLLAMVLDKHPPP